MPQIDLAIPVGSKLPRMTSASLWRRPGGQLIRLVLPAWKAAASGHGVDAFIARKLPELVQMAEVWILDDSRRRSEEAIPDDVLEAALEAAASDDRETLFELVEGVVGDYWAMAALLARGSKLHGQGTRLVNEAFASRGTEDGALLAVLRGERPTGWRPPIYRAMPMSPEDKRHEEDSRDIHDEEVLSLLQVRQHSLDSLEHYSGMTRMQVVAALNRLLRLRRIWRHTESSDTAPQYAPISKFIGRKPPPSYRADVGRPSADEVHGGPARKAGLKARTRARALGGSAERATDLLRPDADGRTLARALLDLTAPRRTPGEVAGSLGRMGHHRAANLLLRTTITNPDRLAEVVWGAVLLEDPVIRVQGTAEAPRVKRAAIREERDGTWVGARRVEAGRAWLERVDVEVVEANANGSTTVRPLADGVLRPGDEIHLWVRSNPAKLAEIYDVLDRFFDDLKYKPEDLASVRPLLFWAGVMLDTPQCTGEARQAAMRAFRQAKLYYDVARESTSRGEIWKMGVLRRVAQAASAVTEACAAGTRPMPGFVFFEPSWEPMFPDSLKTPRQRALYKVLGQNTGLALRVDAAVANVPEDRLAAAVSGLVPGDEAEQIVVVLKSVDTMHADPALRKLYSMVAFDYEKARAIHRVLDDAPDRWRSTLAKQRLVMGELLEALGDPETAARVFQVAKDEDL